MRNRIKTVLAVLLLAGFAALGIYAFKQLSLESQDYDAEAEMHEEMLIYKPNHTEENDVSPTSTNKNLYLPSDSLSQVDEPAPAPEAAGAATEPSSEAPVVLPAETRQTAPGETYGIEATQDNSTIEQLTAAYPDAVGWISIPGTRVEYAFVQGPDNSYYLHRGLNKRYLYAGSLFMDAAAKRDFSCFNTVIYGHNMRNGSMFGDLDKYLSKGFFDQHGTVNIYLPGKTIKATIVACVRTDTTSKPYLYASSESQGFIDNLKADSLYFRHLNTTNPAYITLSTCGYGGDTARFVLIAAYERD